MKHKENDRSSIQIGNHLVGDDLPTYIIAEIGINHNGDVRIARELIDVAAETGVDAVKFQKRHLPSLYREDVLDNTVKYEQNFQYMIPILKQVELDEEKIADLATYCRSKGLEFLCTPFDTVSADFLNSLDVNAFKIASADLCNSELLEHVAGFGKPMLVSTGMSYWKEIEKAVRLIKNTDTPLLLLHCRSAYPVWPREVNLKMINRLRSFGCPVGYSGHDVGIVIPLIAASMGACIIEKHITLDSKMKGPDHKVSLEPKELKRLVRDIKIADQAMGKEKRYLLRGEILNRELFSKSLMAQKDIKSGTVISRDMVVVKGPGKGLAPNQMDALIGKVIKRDLKQNDYFLDQDINGSLPPDFTNSYRSQWGLISRFGDFHEMLGYKPKAIEFHLAEKDFQMAFTPERQYAQQLIVHTPEYVGDRLFDLCSAKKEIRDISIQMLNRTIEFTRNIAPYFVGIPKIIVHPGAMSLASKLEKAPLKSALIESLKAVSNGDVELLLENLPPYPWYFGGQWKGNYFMDADIISQFCEETGRYICFDLSHAALYCNAKEKDLLNYIKTVLPFTRHIHFADAYGVDGEGVQIGEGDIDFNKVMPIFSEFDGTWVPEVWRGHLENGKGFLTALKKLKQFNL